MYAIDAHWASVIDSPFCARIFWAITRKSLRVGWDAGIESREVINIPEKCKATRIPQWELARLGGKTKGAKHKPYCYIAMVVPFGNCSIAVPMDAVPLACPQYPQTIPIKPERSL
jgi:hypothetical protein